MKNSLHDPYIHELRNLFSAEIQMVDLLAKISEAPVSRELKMVVDQHLSETIDELNCLEEIFRSQHLSPKGEHCIAIECLAAECRELFRQGVEPETLDAAMLAIAQKAGSHEIAGYETARAYASLLDERKAEELLSAVLEKEKKVDRKLTHLSGLFVNSGALKAA